MGILRLQHIGCSEMFPLNSELSPLQFHLPPTALVGAAVVVAPYHYLTACACVFALLAGTASTYCLRRRTTVLGAHASQYSRQGASLSHNAAPQGAALHFSLLHRTACRESGIAAKWNCSGTGVGCTQCNHCAAPLYTALVSIFSSAAYCLIHY